MHRFAASYIRSGDVMTERSKRYLQRFKQAGGTIVSVRMTAEQLRMLDRLRIGEIGESRNACVNRLVADRVFMIGMNDMVAPRLPR